MSREFRQNQWEQLVFGPSYLILSSKPQGQDLGPCEVHSFTCLVVDAALLAENLAGTVGQSTHMWPLHIAWSSSKYGGGFQGQAWRVGRSFV